MFRLRSLALAAAVFSSFAASSLAHAQLPEPVMQALRTTGIAEDAVSVRRGRGAFQADVNYGHWSGGVKGFLHHYSTRWAQSK